MCTNQRHYSHNRRKPRSCTIVNKTHYKTQQAFVRESDRGKSGHGIAIHGGDGVVPQIPVQNEIRKSSTIVERVAMKKVTKAGQFTYLLPSIIPLQPIIMT